MKGFLFINCLSLFLLSSTGSTFAQSEYIVTNNGDTIIGNVKKHNPQKVRFKAKGSKSVSKFTPSDIKGFCRDKDRKFRSIFVPSLKETCFLEVLEDGKIKLYAYTKKTIASYGPVYSGLPGGARTSNVFMVDRETWYAEKGGQFVDLKSDSIWSNFRKKVRTGFYSLIADNPIVAGHYNSQHKFGFVIIRKYIKEYNSM